MTTVCQSADLGPACFDLNNLVAGDLNRVGFTIKSGGVPVDITGLTFEAQARAKATDPDPPAITAIIDITDGPNGRGTMRWPGEQTRAVLNGAATWKGVWDLQQTFVDSDPVTLIGGKFGIKSDVTR